MKKKLSAIALCTLMLTSSRAFASGFALPAVGPSSAGVSTVGPSSVFYNPGALGFVRETTVLGGGTLVLGDIRYRRTRYATYQSEDSLDFSLPIDPLSVDSVKTGEDVAVSSKPSGVVPTIFGAMPIGSLPLTAGLAVYVPYAAKVEYDPNGPQRFQLIEATIATVNFTPSIAYRVLDRLSVGAGVSYAFGFANLSKIQDLATLPELGEALARPPINQANDFGEGADPAVRELDTLARPFAFEKGRAHGISFNAGVSAQPIDHLTVAASYTHTTSLTFRGRFTLDMNDSFFTQDLASQGLQYPEMVRGKASLAFVLPRVVRAGARYEFGEELDGAPRSSVALEASYTGWSSIDAFDVRVRSNDLAQPKLGLPASTRFRLARNYRDTYGAITRLTHRLSRVLSIWGALGAETGASPDSTIDAASPDMTRILGSVGLLQNIKGELDLLLDLNVQAGLPRTVTTSDDDLGNGRYELRLYAVGAYLRYAL